MEKVSSMRNFKLQSAMEYLMTYGWAILIIAIVMVALFSLGILGGSPLSTTCLAQSGFTCQSPVLHGYTFNVLIGQATGTSWTTVNVIWVPSGYTVPAAQVCSTNANQITPGSSINTISNGVICGSLSLVTPGLTSGQTATATFVTNSINTAGTTTAAGQIWAEYQTSAGGSTVYVVQMTSGVNLKAV